MLIAPILLLIAAPALTDVQSDASAQSNISVSASSSVRVHADRATIYFLVEGAAETSDLALQRLAQKLQAVNAAIAASGAAAGNPLAFSYGIAATPGSSSAYPSNQPPFTSKTAVRVEVARVDEIPALISSALSAGASGSSAPQFEFTGADTLRMSLIPGALEKARRDADALARGLSGRLGDAVSVSTYGSAGVPTSQPYLYFNRGYESSGQAPIPELVISALVNVQYRLIRR